jgi:hypothetical protein
MEGWASRPSSAELLVRNRFAQSYSVWESYSFARWGLLVSRLPTACAVGFILAPLRGCQHPQLVPLQVENLSSRAPLQRSRLLQCFLHAGPALDAGRFGRACTPPMGFQTDGVVITVALEGCKLSWPIDEALAYGRPL